MATSEPAHVIPAHRLPPGFAQGLEDRVGEPATPRPAATVVLLREEGAKERMEVLLLRRTRSAGFVPGAYVFPGGRVDPADGSPEVRRRLTGLDPDELAARMGLGSGLGDGGGLGGSGSGAGAGDDALPNDSPPPAFAFLVAAFRETFEETGILPGLSPEILGARHTGDLRDKLLGKEISFHQVLEALDARLDGASAAYIAHWVTPEAEPRRYDTRFFALHVAPGLPVSPQESEVSDALWITPARALERHHHGKLPMIFPTIHTLEELARFDSPAELLADYRTRDVPRLLPRLVPAPEGIGIVLPDHGTPPASEGPAS